VLQKHRQNPEKTLQRIRILGIGKRNSNRHFRKIASAVLEDKRLHIHYTSRSDNRASERELSPQRLTHYRDNWYLDAWCHLRKSLRTFALDQISECRLLDKASRTIGAEQLDSHLASAYGIFAGEADQTAVLKFNEKRARWVEKEQWHPHQQGQWQDGHYILQLPYHKSEELIMDILKYGPDVEVLAPDSLRRAVQNRIREMAAPYGM
jgi:predicted DNA-binding transcriptional regulator YafY